MACIAECTVNTFFFCFLEQKWFDNIVQINCDNYVENITQFNLERFSMEALKIQILEIYTGTIILKF